MSDTNIVTSLARITSLSQHAEIKIDDNAFSIVNPDGNGDCMFQSVAIMTEKITNQDEFNLQKKNV